MTEKREIADHPPKNTVTDQGRITGAAARLALTIGLGIWEEVRRIADELERRGKS